MLSSIWILSGKRLQGPTSSPKSRTANVVNAATDLVEPVARCSLKVARLNPAPATMNDEGLRGPSKKSPVLVENCLAMGPTSHAR
jgi:hypothetical protein